MRLVERVKAEALGFWAEGRIAKIAFWAAITLLAVIVFDMALALTTGWSAWTPFSAWLTTWNHDWEDSWSPMNAALNFWRYVPEGRLYHELFEVRGIKFQYPPTSLLPWLVFQKINFPLNDYVALNHLGRAFILINAIAVGALSWLLMKRWRPEAPKAGLAIALICAAASLFFYPMLKAWHLGQIQVWINAAFAVACVAWLLDRRVFAGVLIACITLLKPQFGLFFLWGLVRKDWRFIGGFAGFGGAMGVLSLAMFGLHNHLDYLSLLSELSRHGESFYNNQSVNGLLNRLFHNGPNLVFEDSALPPYNPFIHGATLLTSAALIGLALWPRKNGDTLFDFMLAGLCFTAASPIAWEHHYGVMAPMLAALFCRLAARVETTQRDWIWFGVFYVLTSMSFLFLNATAETPLNFVQSHLFFGALGVLWLIWKAREDAPAKQAISERA